MAVIGDLTTAQGIYVQDSTKMMNIKMPSMVDSDVTPKWGMLIEKLELKLYRQSIRIIQLENKLNAEECENLKNMLDSHDTPSIILAKEIIDNLETGEYD